MAYINSANVKFSDRADLIIEEDGTGTVTKCLNRSNGVDYTQTTTFAAITAVITNNTSGGRTISFPYVTTPQGETIRTTSASVAAGATYNGNTVCKNATISLTGSFKFDNLTGDLELLDATHIICKGDGTATIENP